MRVATIDIGTNTVLLLVAERGADGSFAPSRSGPRSRAWARASIARVGSRPTRVERTRACLDEYAARRARAAASSASPSWARARCATRAVARSCARAFVRRLGVEARVVSGDEEARLTFRGALSGLALDGADEVAVFDIGGGSTEVVIGTPSATTSRSICARASTWAACA